MDISAEQVAELAEGTAHRFADWPNVKVPTFGAGVYTVWHVNGNFIYVGMSGRGISNSTVPRNTPHGIHTRLASHAKGRRSGDQFCVYVADRLVLADLNADQIAAIAGGRHQLDAYVRRYIHDHLLYRYTLVEDGLTALAIEAQVRSGKWGRGQPLLNPSKPA